MNLKIAGYLRANSLHSGAKLLERVGAALLLDLSSFHLESYPEDPALMRFHGELTLPNCSQRDALYETLARFASVAPRVTVSPPRDSLAWDFLGEIRGSSIAGLESLTFEASGHT